MRIGFGIVALVLGSYLAYDAHLLYQAMSYRPPGTLAEYTEHLIMIGGVAFQPVHLIGGLCATALLFCASGVYLLVTGRDSALRS